MPEAATAQRQNARPASAVILTEDGDGGIGTESAACVLVGDRIREEARLGSDLLSGIGNTNGIAALPHHVSSEDLQLWQAATLVNIYCKPLTEELVTIIKVADAIGDSNIHVWVDMLGKRAAGMNWRDPGDSATDSMHTALLSLPAHILPTVLATHLDGTLPELFASVPCTLHPAVLAAAIAASKNDEIAGTLTLDMQCLQQKGALGRESPAHGTQRLLMMLATARPPHPGLLAFRVHNAATLLPTTASAALLAQVLTSHPSLRELELHFSSTESHLSAAWLSAFAGCLGQAALPSLTALHIGIQAAGGTCPALARCLKFLPALVQLTVSALLEKNSPMCQEPAPMRAFTRPVACPALLSSLQQLDLIELSDPRYPTQGSPESTLMPQLLPMLRAPALTRLKLQSDAHSVSCMSLLACLRYTPSLHRLEVCGLLRDCIQIPKLAIYPATTSMPALQELHISSSEPQLPLRMVPAVLASQTSVTSIVVGVQGRNYYASRNFVVVGVQGRNYSASRELFCGTEGWPVLLEAVACCRQLQKLELANLHYCEHDTGLQDLTVALRDVLVKLPALTSLTLQATHIPSIQGHRRVLCAETLASALRALTGLQSLVLNYLQDSLQAPEHARCVLEACAALPQLTHLGLLCHGVGLGLVSEVIPQVTALVSITLPESLFSGDTNIEEYRHRFPGVNTVNNVVTASLEPQQQ